MAPPLTLTLFSSRPSSFMHAIAWTANASFNSISPISFIFNFVLFRSFFTAGIGPVPIISGGTPAAAESIILSLGFKPMRNAFFLSITSKAAAPSLMPEELPAVTVPPSLKAGFNFARSSKVTSSRGCSSVSKLISSLFFIFIDTGIISFLKYPFLMASQAFCWLLAAYWSCSFLLILYFSAMFSAVMPI